MDLMSRERWALAAIIGGAALAAAGTMVYISARRGSLAGAGLGRPMLRGRRKAGGMELKHYRGRLPIGKRVKILQELTWDSVQDPRMRKLALEVTSACPARDGNCEARAVYDWVRKNVRYTGDVAPVKQGARGPYEGVDLFQSAYRTVEFGGGDCDDHAVLAATLLTLNGISAKFRVTGRAAKAEFSHIYTMAGLPKMGPSSWVAVDSTLPGENYGHEAPHGRKADFPA